MDENVCEIVGSNIEIERPIETVIYLAGVFDGEGCITSTRTRSNKHVIQVKCAMYHPVPIKLFQKLFGGYCAHNNSPSRPFPIWSWGLAGKSAIVCVKELFPYLTVKKYQAAIAMLFYQECFEKRNGTTKRVTPEELKKRDFYVEELAKAKNDFSDWCSMY